MNANMKCVPKPCHRFVKRKPDSAGGLVYARNAYRSQILYRHLLCHVFWEGFAVFVELGFDWRSPVRSPMLPSSDFNQKYFKSPPGGRWELGVPKSTVLASHSAAE